MSDSKYYLILSNGGVLEFKKLDEVYQHLISAAVLAGQYIIIKGEQIT